MKPNNLRLPKTCTVVDLALTYASSKYVMVLSKPKLCYDTERLESHKLEHDTELLGYPLMQCLVHNL